MDAQMNIESSSNPVRFQLKTARRIPNPIFQDSIAKSTSDPDNPGEDVSSLEKPRRPRRVVFPTISEEEFLEVVDRIANASLVKHWKEAFDLVDFLCARKCDERVMEMKAQLQLETGENFEAVKNCERAIKLNPLWWEGHRTHGRCLLALGEPALAVKAFERAIYINPADDELRSEFRAALGSSATHSQAEAARHSSGDHP